MQTTNKNIVVTPNQHERNLLTFNGTFTEGSFYKGSVGFSVSYQRLMESTEGTEPFFQHVNSTRTPTHTHITRITHAGKNKPENRSKGSVGFQVHKRQLVATEEKVPFAFSKVPLVP